MKITKAEKIWLSAVIIFYICYNLPLIPPYGHAKATLIHALITLVPLWISIYIGLVKVCRIYRIRDPKTSASSQTSGQTSADKEHSSNLISADNEHCSDLLSADSEHHSDLLSADSEHHSDPIPDTHRKH